MTNSYFSPRDVGLYLARRMRLGSTIQAAMPHGHPLDVTQAIRNLSTLRGRDASAPDPVAWEPADSSPSSDGPAGTGSSHAPRGVPGFPSSSLPHSALRPPTPLGSLPIDPPMPDDEQSSLPSDLEAAAEPAEIADAALSDGSMPDAASGGWRAVSNMPIAMPPGLDIPPAIDAVAAARGVLSELGRSASTRSATESGAPSQTGGAPGSTIGQRAGKRLHVELKLVGKSEQLSAELKAVAQQTSEKAIKYHQFVRDRQIYASIRKH